MKSPASLMSGSPYPLGATWDGSGVNFAVFSAHAEKIELCLFDEKGRHEVARLPLPECTDEVFHGYLPDARVGQIYGYRAYGPYEPQRGHRFNPNKLLLDPYARRLYGALRWSDVLYGYRAGSVRADLSFDRRDSAAAMPKSVVSASAFDWGEDRPPRRPWAETVIYEAHLRGLTMLHPDVRPDERGSFAALGHPRIIEHLQRLGVTAIELLPVHAVVHERELVSRHLCNYWGYNTLAYFVPEPRYLSSGTLREMRTAIRQLHDAGIEILLDVVYNHTGEGSEQGPTLSFRGLDNASYYRLVPGDERLCINDTGCGNTLNLSHPRVIQLVMDSLRYWVDAFHVDGFRFDLSTTLGRETDGFDPGAGFFDALRQDPQLSRVKLIAEPWDIGPGGYQLGQHPPGMAEWNDRFRDDVRRFWRGDAGGGVRGALASRLHGSGDSFEHHQRRPWASVNYVTAHDGFTLKDLVSYAHKHNEANGEDNRDGHAGNHSANWGVEGPSVDPAIMEQRRKIKRAMLATLLCSQGTPMLLAGDELGHSQNGNNNAYCQDNRTTWLDWSEAETDSGRALSEFVARLAGLRKEHPSLRWGRYLHGRAQPIPEVADIDWFGEAGERLQPEEWYDTHSGVIALRRAVEDAGRVDVSLVLINRSAEARRAVLPPPDLHWRLAMDTAEPSAAVRDVAELAVEVAAFSVVVLVAAARGGNA